MTIASLTVSTANRKLTRDKRARPVSVTRAAQRSCPRSCPFLNSGCYAESGPAGIHSSRLNRAAAGLRLSSRDIARAEAREISAAWPIDGRPLRLHEVGDARTASAARILARAVAARQALGAGLAWTYTHAWDTVRRREWGSVSVLASVETTAQARAARRAGYALAMVARTVADGIAKLRAARIRGIPCPAESGAAADCASCGLCMRADRLRELRRGIIFTPHGSGARRVREKV